MLLLVKKSVKSFWLPADVALAGPPKSVKSPKSSNKEELLAGTAETETYVDDDDDNGNEDAANESVGTGNDTGLGAWNVFGKALLVTEQNERSDEGFS